jgi:hypothetical protein
VLLCMTGQITEGFLQKVRTSQKNINPSQFFQYSLCRLQNLYFEVDLIESYIFEGKTMRIF